MSVMSVSTVTTPLLSSRTRAADFVSRLLRKAAATPMPTSQRPSRTWPGCGLRLLQPKRSAPVRRHSTSWRCENGRSGFSGIDLGVVEDAELDRIEAELLGHLVHGDLQRHHARRLARRAHRIAFRQVEHRKPRRGHAVGAGIEQPRLADRRLRLAAGQIAGPALVADRGDLAVPGRADADALDRRRPMRGVVEHQRPRQRHLHRPPRRARAERGEQRVGAQEQLAAEAAADEGRDRRTFSLGMPSVLAMSRRAPVDHLVRGPERELVAVPGRDRRMRLHHRVRLVGRGVASHRAGPARPRRRRRSRRRRCRRGAAGHAVSGFAAVSFTAARSNAPSALTYSTRTSCAAARACSKVSATTRAIAW